MRRLIFLMGCLITNLAITAQSYAIKDIPASLLKNANVVAGKVNVMWTNFDNGVLGVSSSTTSLAVNAINQAFTQSPYILHSH